MRLADVHPAFRELLAAQTALEKLGFTHDEIGYGPDGEDPTTGNVGPYIQLQAQGKEFVYAPGIPWEGDSFEASFRAAMDVWNESSQDERENLWQKSGIREQSFKFVAVLDRLGFRFDEFDWFAKLTDGGMRRRNAN